MLPIISIMILIPIIALAATAAFGRSHRKILLGSTLINMLLAFGMLAIALSTGSASISEQYPYIPSLGISLGFRIDIIPLMLLIMSAVVLFVAALAANPGREKPKTASVLILLFQLAAVGFFASANLLLFFVFWDIGVIALFLMINILGSANRKAASINFLIYEILASSFLFLGIILIYAYTPVHSFNIAYIAANAASISPAMQSVIFALFFLAFMINMPIFPMHFWLPDAHTEASASGSMLLSGILTKFGAFGMLILFSMMPIAAQYSPYIAALAIVSTFYSVLLLLRQKDLKRIIAYSTIVEMGIILLGISVGNSLGTCGAAYLMLSHGLVIALMFLVVGMLKYIFGERGIQFLKGTVLNAQFTTYAFVFGVFAMVGLPLTSGFIADIMLFAGSFQAFGIYGLLPLAALAIMGAYMYFAISKSMLSTTEHSFTMQFIGKAQKFGYSILIFFILLFGILPFILLNLVKVW